MIKTIIGSWVNCTPHFKWELKHLKLAKTVSTVSLLFQFHNSFTTPGWIFTLEFKTWNVFWIWHLRASALLALPDCTISWAINMAILNTVVRLLSSAVKYYIVTHANWQMLPLLIKLCNIIYWYQVLNTANIQKIFEIFYLSDTSIPKGNAQASLCQGHNQTIYQFSPVLRDLYAARTSVWAVKTPSGCQKSDTGHCGKQPDPYKNKLGVPATPAGKAVQGGGAEWEREREESGSGPGREQVWWHQHPQNPNRLPRPGPPSQVKADLHQL